MIGMYLTYVFNTYLGLDPYLSIPLVVVCMFALGALIQHTLITPSLGTKSFTNLLFLTVGLGIDGDRGFTFKEDIVHIEFATVGQVAVFQVDANGYIIV